ncbi:MAG: hypothetical protein AAF432_05315 [Planctomycetota bacterium]
MPAPPDVSWLLPALLFLLLALPGLPVVRWLDRRWIEAGWPALYGVSTIVTLTIFTPIAIACYLMGTPVIMPAILMCNMMLAGLIWLIIQRAWRDLRTVFTGLCGIELVLLIDAWLSFRHGTHFGGDTSVHLARIRMLVDHGLSNTDPFVAESFFWPIYHTNIVHLLHAMFATLTDRDAFLVWISSLTWSRLLIVCGTYTLAWSVFRKRWIAWTAAVFMLAAVFHSSLLAYPNKIAPFGIVPIIIALSIRALDHPKDWRPAALLAGAMLVLGQVHGMYVIFVAAFVTPVMLTAVIVRMVRTKSIERWSLIAVATIVLGLPFPMISQIGIRNARADRTTTAMATPTMITMPSATIAAVTAPAPATQSREANPTPRRRGGHFLTLDNGWQVRNPQRGITARTARPVLLIALAALGIVVLREWRLAVVFGCGLTVAMMLFIPPLCTAALDFFGAGWIVLRAQFLILLVFAVIVPTVPLMIGVRCSDRWIRRSESTTPNITRATSFVKRGAVLLGLCWAAYLGYWYHGKAEDYHRYIETARKPKAQRVEVHDTRQRVAAHIEELVKPGSTVLCDLEISSLLCSLTDVHVVASRSSSLGVPDLAQRRRDVRTMIAEETPWPQRRALLRKYDARYYVRTDARAPIEWAMQHGTALVQMNGAPFVIQLDLEN